MKEPEQLTSNKSKYYQPVLVVHLSTLKIKRAKQRELWAANLQQLWSLKNVWKSLALQ